MKSKKNILNKSSSERKKQNETIFYRLIFMGDSGVGKTQIINRYNNKLFEEQYYPTFSIDFQIKKLNISGIHINIHCIDTVVSDLSKATENSNEEENYYEEIGKTFFKKAHAFILVYDITSKQTFDNLSRYYDIFKFCLNDIKGKYNKKIIYIVGNKIDLRLNREVTDNEVKKSSIKYEAKSMEVSAKNGLNIDRLFNDIIEDLMKNEKNNNINPENSNNNIYNKTNNISQLYNLRNNSLNRVYTEHESRINFESSSSYYLQSRNFNLNEDYINNLNNNDNINRVNIQSNIQNEDNKNSFYLNNNNNEKKCSIF